MRRVALVVPLVVAAAACLNPDNPNPRPSPSPIGNACVPGQYGLGDGTAWESPPFSLPPGCDVLVDSGTVAVFRRQVSEITSPAALAAVCHLSGGDAGVALDAGAAGAIDFTVHKLLIVRVPETQNYRWAVQKDGLLTIGESTTVCSGVRAEAIRYARLVPRTATVAFRLCRPPECGEDDN